MAKDGHGYIDNSANLSQSTRELLKFAKIQTMNPPARIDALVEIVERILDGKEDVG